MKPAANNVLGGYSMYKYGCNLFLRNSQSNYVFKNHFLPHAKAALVVIGREKQFCGPERVRVWLNELCVKIIEIRVTMMK